MSFICKTFECFTLISLPQINFTFHQVDLANIEKGECVIGKVSRIVNSIRHSNLDSELLVKSVGFRLPAMNATRWISQHNMISIFLNALEVDPSLPTKLNAFQKLKPEQKLYPTDIKILKELVLLLAMV